MAYYYMHYTDLAPEALKAKHPNAIQYATLSLFVSGMEQLEGVAPADRVDLVAYGFNHPYVEGAPGITAAHFDAIVDQFLAPLPPATGAEVRITKAMANYIRDTRFPDTGGEI